MNVFFVTTYLPGFIFLSGLFKNPCILDVNFFPSMSQALLHQPKWADEQNGNSAKSIAS